MSDGIGPIKDIAMRLRGIREVTDLTLEQLAEKTGVSPEKAREYEGGEKEIPVSYLYKAAQACGVDLTSLLTGGEAHLKTYSLVRAGNGLGVDRRKAYNYQSLAYRFHRPSMEPFLVTVPPKDAADQDLNSHLGEEFIYLLSGRLEITLGGETVVMEPHDSLYFDSRTPHAMRALDGQDAQFLDVII